MFKPLSDKILIRVEEQTEQTPGGIVIPNSAVDKPPVGEVLAVGPGIYDQKEGKLIPVSVNVGDKIAFVRLGVGTEIEIDGELLLVIKEEDVLGIITQK